MLKKGLALVMSMSLVMSNLMIFPLAANPSIKTKLLATTIDGSSDVKYLKAGSSFKLNYIVEDYTSLLSGGNFDSTFEQHFSYSSELTAGGIVGINNGVESYIKNNIINIVYSGDDITQANLLSKNGMLWSSEFTVASVGSDVEKELTIQSTAGKEMFVISQSGVSVKADVSSNNNGTLNLVLDTKSPVITKTPATTTPLPEKTTVSVKDNYLAEVVVMKGTTEIDKKIITDSSTSYTKELTGKGSYLVTATDKSGNTSTETIAIGGLNGTVTTITSSQTDVTFGDSVTLKATVDKGTLSETFSGTVQFKLDGTDIGSAVALTLDSGNKYQATLSLTKEMYKTTGTKKITAVYSGNSDYAPSTTSELVTTISKKGISEMTVTLDSNSFVYDGIEKKPTATVSNGANVLTESDYTTSYLNNKDAGTATVTITGAGNYSGTLTKTFAIDKAAATAEKKISFPVMSNSANNITIDISDSKYRPSYAHASGDITITTSVENTSNLINGETKIENNNLTFAVSPKTSGIKSTITLTFKSKNYNDSAVVIEVLTTDKIPLNITGITASNKVYDGTKNATVSVSGAVLSGVISGDVVNLSSTNVKGEFTSANVTTNGTITLTGFVLSGKDAEKYILNTITLNAKITEKELTITPKDGQFAYSGQNAKVDYTVSGEAPGETSAFDGELSYGSNTTIGKRPITIGTLSLKDNNGFKSTNYTVKFVAGKQFEVRQYDPIIKVTPSGTKGDNDWYRSNVTINPPANHKISKDAILWEDSLIISDEGDISQDYYLKSSDGSTSPKMTVSLQIDKTTPSVSGISGNLTEWVKSDATISIISTDSLSGIANYSFDGGKTWQTTGVKTFSENTKFTVQVKDKAGNILTYSPDIEITNIDKELPTISAVTLNTTAPTNQVVYLNVGADDKISKIKEYSFDGGKTWKTSSENSYEENVKIPANMIKVKDNAGNITTYSLPINISNIDKISPKATHYPNPEFIKLNPAGGDTIKVEFSEVVKGIPTVDSGATNAQIDVSGKKISFVTPTSAYSAKTTYTISGLTDLAGNNISNPSVIYSTVDEAKVGNVIELPPKKEISEPVLEMEDTTATFKYSQLYSTQVEAATKQLESILAKSGVKAVFYDFFLNTQTPKNGANVHIPMFTTNANKYTYSTYYFENGNFDLKPKSISTTLVSGIGIKFNSSSFGPFVIVATPIPTSGGGGSDSNDSFRIQEEATKDFWEDVLKSIKTAQAGSTITAKSGIYDQVPFGIMIALKENDVNLVIKWSGADIIIPAGKALAPESSRIYYPLTYLDQQYKGSIKEDVVYDGSNNPITGGVTVEPKIKVEATNFVPTSEEKGFITDVVPVSNTELSFVEQTRILTPEIIPAPAPVTQTRQTTNIVAIFAVVLSGMLLVGAVLILKNIKFN